MMCVFLAEGMKLGSAGNLTSKPCLSQLAKLAKGLDASAMVGKLG
jgi:hypothetical protein